MSAAPCPKESVSSAARAVGRALEAALTGYGDEAPRSSGAATPATRPARLLRVASPCYDSNTRGWPPSWREGRSCPGQSFAFTLDCRVDGPAPDSGSLLEVLLLCQAAGTSPRAATSPRAPTPCRPQTDDPDGSWPPLSPVPQKRGGPPPRGSKATGPTDPWLKGILRRSSLEECHLLLKLS